MCVLHTKNGLRTLWRSFRAAHIPSCTRHTHRMPCHAMPFDESIWMYRRHRRNNVHIEHVRDGDEEQYRAVCCVLSRFNHFVHSAHIRVDCCCCWYCYDHTPYYLHTFTYELRHCYDECREFSKRRPRRWHDEGRRNNMRYAWHFTFGNILFLVSSGQLLAQHLAHAAINLGNEYETAQCKWKSKSVSGGFGHILKMGHIISLDIWRFYSFIRHLKAKKKKKKKRDK